MSDIVRVLRVIEYIGPREVMEKQVRLSLRDGTHVPHGNMTIKVATVGDFPEVLGRARPIGARPRIRRQSLGPVTSTAVTNPHFRGDRKVSKQLQRVRFQNEEYIYNTIADSYPDPVTGEPVDRPALLVPTHLADENGELSVVARAQELAALLGLGEHPRILSVGNDEVRLFGERIGSRNEIEFITTQQQEAA